MNEKEIEIEAIYIEVGGEKININSLGEKDYETFIYLTEKIRLDYAFLKNNPPIK